MTSGMKANGLERVVVVGSSGCGKSHLARELARLLGQPYVELDELQWAPNWTEKPEEEFRRLVGLAIAEPRWIIDGNYSRLRDLIWTRATAVIWLNFGFMTVLSRALDRTVDRLITREPYWHGNRESFTRILSRDSILLYVLTTFHRRRRQYRALQMSGKYPHLAWIELRHPSQARRFLSMRSRASNEHPAVHA